LVPCITNSIILVLSDIILSSAALSIATKQKEKRNGIESLEFYYSWL
jgi:hypothetical protein